MFRKKTQRHLENVIILKIHLACWFQNGHLFAFVIFIFVTLMKQYFYIMKMWIRCQVQFQVRKFFENIGIHGNIIKIHCIWYIIKWYLSFFFKLSIAEGSLVSFHIWTHNTYLTKFLLQTDKSVPDLFSNNAVVLSLSPPSTIKVPYGNSLAPDEKQSYSSHTGPSFWHSDNIFTNFEQHWSTFENFSTHEFQQTALNLVG